MYEWIYEANDTCMRRVNGDGRKMKVVWWNRDLEKKKREVGRLRKAYQKERRRTGYVDRRKWYEYQVCLSAYKGMIMEAKEKNGRDFVNWEGKDPWAHFTRICMGRKRTSKLAGLRRLDGGLTQIWQESAQLLIDELLPLDGGVPIPEDRFLRSPVVRGDTSPADGDPINDRDRSSTCAITAAELRLSIEMMKKYG